MRRFAATFVSATGIFAAALAAGDANGAAPSRIVDRTFVCTPNLLYGGIRELDLVTSPRGALGGPTTFDVSPGYISVRSGRSFFHDLIAVRARQEERTRNPSLPPGVYMQTRQCGGTRRSIPLSRKGLAGPPVEYAQDADCEIRGRLLVRVRAELEAPTSWGVPAPPYAGVRRNVVAAKVAVRSERTRKPLGFLELDSAGRTKLWTFAGCS